MTFSITMAVRQFRPAGGAEKFSLRLARHLLDCGHRVRVLAIKAEPMDGIELVRVAPPRFTPRASRDYFTGRVLADALAAERVDVTWGEQKTWGANVIRPGGGVEEDYWNVHGQFRPFGVQLPGWTRHLHTKRLFDLKAEANGYRHPSLKRVIVNAAIVRSALLRHYPNLQGRIDVVHNGVEEERVDKPVMPDTRKRIHSRWNLNPDCPTAVFMGHDFRRKGLAHAMEAVSLVRRRAPSCGFQLIVAGRDRPGPYRALAHSLGIDAATAFLGESEKPDDVFAAGDVLIHPSHHDPFANVTIEALGRGLPVITTLANGGHEIIDQGIDGWVVDSPRNTHQIAVYLGELLGENKRTSMSKAAIAKARKHLLRKKLEKIESILSGVADQYRA